MFLHEKPSLRVNFSQYMHDRSGFAYSILTGSSIAEELKKLPAPEVAIKYYTGDDLYLFGKFVSHLLFFSCMANFLCFVICHVNY